MIPAPPMRRIRYEGDSALAHHVWEHAFGCPDVSR